MLARELLPSVRAAVHVSPVCTSNLMMSKPAEDQISYLGIIFVFEQKRLLAPSVDILHIFFFSFFFFFVSCFGNMGTCSRGGCNVMAHVRVGY